MKVSNLFCGNKFFVCIWVDGVSTKSYDIDFKDFSEGWMATLT